MHFEPLLVLLSTLANYYGVVKVEDQEHELWSDSSNVYSLSGFGDGMV
jgi:hypothetical protein